MTVTMIADARSLDELCERIRAANRVGIDTEFHSERTYAARLMVVQIAFEDGAAIVDPLTIADLSPLAGALHETTVVGHALSSDLKIFADRFDRVPRTVFDCQVAAAFLGYGMQVSLADLVRDVQHVRLTKSQTVSDWSTRPLTARQIEYLVDDVAHLLPMHDNLLERLERAGRRDWAQEECALLANIDRYRADAAKLYLRIPGVTKMNRRELGILNELVQWRDRVARERDLPPKYVLSDDVIAGIASLRPKREDDLAQLRRLDAGARRTHGTQILAAVARGEQIPDDELPPKPAKPLGNARETLATLMSVIVGEIARDLNLPPSLLVPRAALERVAREIPVGTQALEDCLDLSAWRIGVVAEPIARLLSGESSLRVEGYQTGDPKIHLSP